MNIICPAFENNQTIPTKYTCTGEGINPPLEFSEIPTGTISLVLVMDDPDAPSGDFVHWLLWNISPQILKIEKNSAPADAVEGTTSAGKPGYVPPCPPSGTHHYQFKLYALNCVVDLESSATKKDLLEFIETHILGEAIYIGLYSRQ